MTVYRRRLSVEIDLAQDEFTFPVVVESKCRESVTQVMPALCWSVVRLSTPQRDRREAIGPHLSEHMGCGPILSALPPHVPLVHSFFALSAVKDTGQHPNSTGEPIAWRGEPVVIRYRSVGAVCVCLKRKARQRLPG